MTRAQYLPDLILESGPYVDVRFFGAVGDGATDDTTAIANAVAASAGKILFFPAGTYLTDTLDISATVPVGIEAASATIKARSIVTNLVYIENPHDSVKSFFCRIGEVDADDKAVYGVHIKGANGIDFYARITSATSHGIYLHGDDGYGIYYSNFRIFSRYNGGNGIHIDSLDLPSNRISSNVFTCCTSVNNLGHGWYSSYAQNTFIGCEAEINNGYGFYVRYGYSNDFIGGYSENNHLNMAQGGVSDAGDDESFYIDTASRIKVLGGRHIGAITDADGVSWGAGRIFWPGGSSHDSYTLGGTDATGTFVNKMKGQLTTTGEFTAGLSDGGGLGLSGSGPIDNSINIAGDASTFAKFYVSGTLLARLKESDLGLYLQGPLFPKGQVSAAIYAGNDSPEGSLTAAVGSLYMNNSGTSSNFLYIKESGTGNTGWISRTSEFYGYTTIDFASIADGASQQVDVTVTGAALGDYAIASSSIDTQGIVLGAQVTAADTVTVTAMNLTGAAINLTNLTLRVRVLDHHV